MTTEQLIKHIRSVAPSTEAPLPVYVSREVAGKAVPAVLVSVERVGGEPAVVVVGGYDERNDLRRAP